MCDKMLFTHTEMHLYVRVLMCKPLMFMFIGIWSVTKSCKITNKERKLAKLKYIYEGESTENLKSAIKIRTTPRLSFKFQQ